MQRENLEEWLKRRPFLPFRVRLTDGRTFDVRHPRTNLLAQTFIKSGVPERDRDDPWSCDHTEFVPLGTITQLEPLTAVSSS